MLATDLDGTLLDSRGNLPNANREILEELGRRGILRVIVTGRSLYSARAVVDESVPIDYLVFSSGAGVLHWQSQRLEEAIHLSASGAARAIACLQSLDLCFMIHGAIPENHRFEYVRATDSNSDFERRIDRYRKFAREWSKTLPKENEACQIVAVESGEGIGHYQRVREELSELSVVRTTSPLDHVSRWIEIFAPSVSKAQATKSLCRRHGVDERDVVAVGNDYNDEDLLAWAAHAFVVENAPEDLKSLHRVVPSNDEAGFAEAARHRLSLMD